MDQPIDRQIKIRNKYHVNKSGKPAKTVFKVLKRYNSMTLCGVFPTTGRTHQIRVHAQFIGHPIIGDPLYGKSKSAKGQRLQAFELAFKHPSTGIDWLFRLPLSRRIGVKSD